VVILALIFSENLTAYIKLAFNGPVYTFHFYSHLVCQQQQNVFVALELFMMKMQGCIFFQRISTSSLAMQWQHINYEQNLIFS